MNLHHHHRDQRSLLLERSMRSEILVPPNRRLLTDLIVILQLIREPITLPLERCLQERPWIEGGACFLYPGYSCNAR